MSTLKDDSVIAMIAKRNSGKSVLCRDILYHHRNIPVGVIISPTEKANAFYGDFVPDSFIHDEFDSLVISKLLQRQEILIHKQKKNKMLTREHF